MPIVKNDGEAILPQKIGNISVLFWKINETGKRLRELFNERGCLRNCGEIPAFGSEKRTREWIAARLLFSQLCPDLQLRTKPNGAPEVITNKNIFLSISHSGDYACIATSQSRLGIDIERTSYKAFNLRTKYLGISDSAAISNPTMATVAWSAKEAAYKFAEVQHLSLKDDIKLQHISTEENAIAAKIHANANMDDISCRIIYRVFPSFVFTLCAANTQKSMDTTDGK